jgi:hypothetical protein
MKWQNKAQTKDSFRSNFSTFKIYDMNFQMHFVINLGCVLTLIQPFVKR